MPSLYYVSQIFYLPMDTALGSLTGFEASTEMNHVSMTRGIKEAIVHSSNPVQVEDAPSWKNPKNPYNDLAIRWSFQKKDGELVVFGLSLWGGCQKQSKIYSVQLSTTYYNSCNLIIQYTQMNAYNHNLTSFGMIFLASWSISPDPPGKTRRNSSSKKPLSYLKSSQTADQFKAPVDSELVVKPSVCCVNLVCRFVVLVRFPALSENYQRNPTTWLQQVAIVMVNVVSEVFSGQSMVLSCKDSLHWFYYLLKLTRYWMVESMVVHFCKLTFIPLDIEFDPLVWINIISLRLAGACFEVNLPILFSTQHRRDINDDVQLVLHCFHGCLESCKIHGKLELSWGHTPLFLVPSDFLKIRIRLIWTRYILRLGDICTVLYQLYSSASVL